MQSHASAQMQMYPVYLLEILLCVCPMSRTVVCCVCTETASLVVNNMHDNSGESLIFPIEQNSFPMLLVLISLVVRNDLSFIIIIITCYYLVKRGITTPVRVFIST
jgi:hypothetical protein